MKQYNCRNQIFAMKGEETPKYECKSCTADHVNNPKCDKYKPISPLDLNGFFARSELEEKIE